VPWRGFQEWWLVLCRDTACDTACGWCFGWFGPETMGEYGCHNGQTSFFNVSIDPWIPSISHASLGGRSLGKKGSHGYSAAAAAMAAMRGIPTSTSRSSRSTSETNTIGVVPTIHMVVWNYDKACHKVGVRPPMTPLQFKGHVQEQPPVPAAATPATERTHFERIPITEPMAVCGRQVEIRRK
jgi:hypothetical protein